ncbi:MAG: DNA repair protein RadC [Blautia sp.]|nr:DNA repair protein RadC [Blautia sp.]
MKKSYLIKDLPEADRPYEKFMAQGSAALTDRELLAIILRTGTRGKNSLDVASDVLALSQGKPYEGILGLLHLSLEELMQVDGIGKVKAMELKCIGELSHRISTAYAKTSVSFRSASSVADYYMERLRHKEKEELFGIMLDSKLGLLGEAVFSTGTVNKTLLDTREVFREAMRLHAVSFILVHNHPSGDPTPSESDIEITERLARNAKIIDLTLLDHIIIGDKRYFSFKEQLWKGGSPV